MPTHPVHRALLRAGGRSLLSWEGCLGPELPSRLAAVCTRLLQLPDTSGAFVWRLLLQMLATMPQELGPHLEAISTAAAQQLQQGSPIMQQGLICFFAMLLTIDPGQTFAFLQQRTLPGAVFEHCDSAAVTCHTQVSAALMHYDASVQRAH